MFCVFAMCCAVWADERQTHTQNAENDNPTNESLELLPQEIHKISSKMTKK